MNAMGRILVLAGAGLWLAPLPASAEDVQQQLRQMQERMSQLEDRLQATNDQLQASEQRAAEQQALIEQAGLSDAGSGLSAFLDQIEISGYVDASYSYNFNKIDGNRVDDDGNPLGLGNSNTLARPFDTDANSFNFDALKFAVEKTVSPESRAGFRTDIYYGKTARNLNFQQDGRDDGDVHVSQAFVQYVMPLGDVTLKAGKFVTLLGAEVIEAPYNYNISRSLLFNFAIPFEHTGIMASKKYESGFDWAIGGVNGWDQDTLAQGFDFNKGKSILGRIGYGAEGWALGLNGIFGNEQIGQEDNKRTVLDLVLNLNPTEQFSAYINADYGWEEFDPSCEIPGGADPVAECPPGISFGDTSRTAAWWGVAAAGRYALTEKLGISLRGEWFRDGEGTRFARVAGLGEIGRSVNAYSLTTTLDYVLTENLKVRGEFRHDQFRQFGSDNDSVFASDSGDGTKRNQQTVAAELIYLF